ncbi:MAG: DUF4190 domain-containing protein [Ktedonobacterales bacterium]
MTPEPSPGQDSFPTDLPVLAHDPGPSPRPALAPQAYSVPLSSPPGYGAYPPPPAYSTQPLYLPPPGYPPYPPPGYVPYPPPGYPLPYVVVPAPASPGSGPALASLVLGIASVALVFMPCFSIFAMGAGIAGLITGALGLKSFTRHGMAVAGLVTSVIGLALSVGIAIAYVVFNLLLVNSTLGH